LPIKIPDALPAAKTLESENIFIITENRALHQDIRPLRIAIVNLMPTKIETETQLLRLLGNTPLQVEACFIVTKTHTPKHIDPLHLESFYKTYYDVKDEKFDGIIITGAPVEQLDFEDVDYWQELCEIMAWAKTHVYSAFHICWAAQAGLYYHYGVKKHLLDKKLSGIYNHRTVDKRHPLVRGFDDTFKAPHSRYTEVRKDEILATGKLDILAESDEAGVYIVADKDCRNFFVTGHSEYDLGTLAGEYFRDVKKGINPDIPCNYFEGDDPNGDPVFSWKSHANLLFSNWLNHIVYQQTPYDLSSL